MFAQPLHMPSLGTVISNGPMSYQEGGMPTMYLCSFSEWLEPVSQPAHSSRGKKDSISLLISKAAREHRGGVYVGHLWEQSYRVVSMNFRPYIHIIFTLSSRKMKMTQSQRQNKYQR
jgi:hypothetical protein